MSIRHYLQPIPLFLIVCTLMAVQNHAWASSNIFELQTIRFEGNHSIERPLQRVALRAGDHVDKQDIEESAAALRAQGFSVTYRLDRGSFERHILVFDISHSKAPEQSRQLVKAMLEPEEPNESEAVPLITPTYQAAPIARPLITPISTQKIKAIRFVGNDITRRHTMLDELRFVEGDAFTREKVAAGKQALLNLRLFSKVDSAIVKRPDGHIDVTYTVEEKTYFLPIPRLSVNSSGEASAGVKIRWNNLWGRNHTFSSTIKRKQLADDDKGDQDSIKASYSAPNIGRSGVDLGLNYSRSHTPIFPDVGAPYTETSQRTSFTVGGRLDGDDGRWRVGTGVGVWSFSGLNEQTNVLESDEVPYVRGNVSYRGVDTFLYSEKGLDLSLSAEASLPGGTFNYTRAVLDTRSIMDPTSLEHDNLIIRTQLGANIGRPNPNYEAYTLDNDHIRGIKKGVLRGQAYYAGSAEYLIPVFGTRSLRALLFADVAEVFDDIDEVRIDDPQVSVGLGLRWRPQWFVGLELTLGIAFGFDNNELRGFGGSERFR